MWSITFSPIAFSLGNISIYWYGILFALSLIIARHVAVFILKRNHAFQLSFDSFLLKCIIISIICSRLGHVLFFDLKFYLNNPIEIFMIRHGGLAFHGGVIGILIYIFLYCKKRNISILFMYDMLSIATSAGLITGRLANFVNQELVGKIWASEYGVIFPLIDMFPRYPTQIYEALTEGLLNFYIQILFFAKLGNKSIGTGIYSILFCIIYSSSRFIIEFYKDVEITSVLSMTMGQVLCLIMFIFGIVLYQKTK